MRLVRKARCPERKVAQGLVFLIRARLLQEAHLHTGRSHRRGLHRTLLESQAASERAVSKACELDHDHRVPNATLKLETGLKTQEWLNAGGAYGSLAT